MWVSESAGGVKNVKQRIKVKVMWRVSEWEWRWCQVLTKVASGRQSFAISLYYLSTVFVYWSRVFLYLSSVFVCLWICQVYLLQNILQFVALLLCAVLLQNIIMCCRVAHGATSHQTSISRNDDDAHHLHRHLDAHHPHDDQGEKDFYRNFGVVQMTNFFRLTFL